MYKLKKLLLFAGLCLTILAQLQISHINFKSMIAIKGQKMVSYDATQKGQILAVLTNSKLRVYKLLSLDYYMLYAQHSIQYGRSLSISDIKTNKNYRINNDISFISIINGQNQLMVFKTQTQRSTLQLMVKFTAKQYLISVMSEKKKFPFITLLTKSSIEIYQVSQQKFKMELKKTQFIDKINGEFDQMYFDRVRAEIVVSSHSSAKSIMRIGSGYNQSIIFSHTNLSHSSNKIVDMSWSHNGVQLIVINQEGVELLAKKGQPNMLNRLIKDSREIINNILADRKDQTSRENSITLQIDQKIKGITIDKSSKYVGYLQKSTLNLGEIIRKKTETSIKHIRSYNISKFCSTIVNFTKIMYVYQQRLLIPCYKDDEIRILIIHACQAQACSNFCGGPYCGDCIVDTELLGEECDDCNNIDGDGCSSTCLLEYHTKIELIYIEKSDTENKLLIKLKISPSNLTNWDVVDFSKILTISVPSQPTSPIAEVTYVNLKDGNVLATVVYSSDIQDKQMQVNLDTSQTGMYGLYTLNFAITPFDNQMAFVYDTTVYSLYATTKALGCVAAFGGLIIFVIGIIGSKLIGIQMMAVIQISYLSLISMKSLNPGFNSISQLWFVNGYNKFRFDSSYLVQSQSFKPKGLQLYPYFILNYNLTMVLFFLPILIGIVVLVLSRVWKSTLAEYWPRLFGEYAFNGLMFSAYIIWVSIGLEFMYGISANNSEIGTVSIVLSIFFILVYLFYFILLIIKPEIFNQFTTSFKEDCIDKKVYLALIVERIVIGISLPVMLTTQFSFIFVLVVYIILLICIILKRPYKNTRDNVRQICNFSIVIVIQIIYLCYNIETVSNQNKLQIFMYLPIIVCILLIICVLYSAVALAYEIYLKIVTQDPQQEKLSEKKQKIQTQHINDENQTRRNMVDAAKQSGLYKDCHIRQIGPEKTHNVGKQEYKQSYEAASKIKKELRQNFGINENIQEQSQTKRQKILHDKQESNNYKQM